MQDIFKLFDKIKSSKPQPQGPIEFIIVGLGNPGKQYENTRHNAGYMAVDRISSSYNVKIDKLKFKSLICDVVIGSHRCILMKPTTFMNLSGQAVVESMNYYKVKPENIIILFDDISLEPGLIRIRRKGSDGGHNGMKNIIYLSGLDTFPRIKIGVGKKPNPQYDLADWVLSQFSEQDIKNLDGALNNALESVKLIIDGQIDKAMNVYNS